MHTAIPCVSRPSAALPKEATVLLDLVSYDDRDAFLGEQKDAMLPCEGVVEDGFDGQARGRGDRGAMQEFRSRLRLEKEIPVPPSAGVDFHRYPVDAVPRGLLTVEQPHQRFGANAPSEIVRLVVRELAPSQGEDHLVGLGNGELIERVRAVRHAISIRDD